MMGKRREVLANDPFVTDLFYKHDKDGGGSLDKDEFRRCLKEIDPNKREPLPHNFEWAWMHGDPNNDGSITVYELKALVTMYRTYLEAQNDIVDLIRKHDKNGDCKLEEHEMLGLLQVPYLVLGRVPSACVDVWILRAHALLCRMLPRM